MQSPDKKYFLQTFGCQMNVYDGQRIESMLKGMGYQKTESVSDADITILNTCSVREKASNRVFSALGRIREKKKEDALFGIVGCVAREEGENSFKRIPELNFVLGPQSYHKLPDVIMNPDSKHLNIDLSGIEKFDELPHMVESELVAYIPIQEGCNHCCTFCIVPFTRGREISRPMMDVIDEAKNAAKNGAIEICFLGQNVNGYKYNLAELIKEVAKIPEIKRIRYTSSYPTEMKDDLIALHGVEPKLLPFINMPLQSGSQNILKKMNRPYSIDQYLEIVKKFKESKPDIQISSDFIVGFPNESDQDFNDTCKLAKELSYINSYTFKYSKRPHTGAALMPNQIDPSTKQERLKILDGILNENMKSFNQACIGKIFECLFESKDKFGNLVYRTPYMQQVIVKSEAEIKENLIKIEITESNKHSLRGKICQSL